MADLESVVATKRNSLKTDRLDMSFGELMNMYEDGDLFISPEYQRVFRWSLFQQTRFIESVILGIPIPPIFVAEDEEGKWEVVDGLQRISTIFSFFGLLEDLSEKNNTTLTEGELVPELEGLTINELPIKLKTTIKRSVCRVEIVKWDSTEDIRYELFNRLNTGASPLSDQEIRNCIFRSYPVDLNSILREVAAYPAFKQLIQPSKAKEEEMFLEELVLRYYAFKHAGDDIKASVPQFLSEFMKAVSNNILQFDLEDEKLEIYKWIDFLNESYGKKVFRPNAGFAQHIFDSISYALPRTFPVIEGSEGVIKAKIDELLGDDGYGSIGSSTFSTTRVKKRMERALEIFSNAS